MIILSDKYKKNREHAKILSVLPCVYSETYVLIYPSFCIRRCS